MDGAAFEDQRRALAEEIRRAERALDRYYAAFETGDLDAKRFQTRIAALETRLADLHEQDLALAAQIAPQAPTTPDAANLAAVADQLEDLVSTGDPKQTKALLRLLIKGLRVNGRNEILPTYRVVTDTVCALPSSVERTGIEPVTSGLQTQPDARHLSLLNADRLNRAARVLSASYAFARCRRRDRPAEVVRAC